MLTIKIDEREFGTAMNWLTASMPRGFAMALTWTAKAAQAKVKESLPHSFIVRSPWIVGGIRIKTATVAQQFSEVGSVDPFMAIHEEGGTKKSPSGKSLAVPADIRPTIRDLVKRKDWPGKLLKGKSQSTRKARAKGPEKAKYPIYFMMLSKKRRRWMVAKRDAPAWIPKGKPRAKKGEGGKSAHSPIKIMWVLEKEIEIKEARLHFDETVNKAVREAWPEMASKALDRILRR